MLTPCSTSLFLSDTNFANLSRYAYLIVVIYSPTYLSIYPPNNYLVAHLSNYLVNHLYYIYIYICMSIYPHVRQCQPAIHIFSPTQAFPSVPSCMIEFASNIFPPLAPCYFHLGGRSFSQTCWNHTSIGRIYALNMESYRNKGEILATILYDSSALISKNSWTSENKEKFNTTVP